MDPARLPPNNVVAEAALLGSLLRSNAMVDEVSTLIGEESFYSDAHRKVYRAILDLRHANKTADLVTVAEMLDSRKQIEDCGGFGKLGELWEAVAGGFNAVHYAEIVREHAQLRGLLLMSMEINSAVHDRSGPSTEILDRAQSMVYGLSQAGTVGRTGSLTDSLYALMREVDARATAGPADVVPTGLFDLDRVLAGGLHPGEMVVVGARTSVGKSAFAANVVRNASMHGVPCFVVSVEMSRLELSARLLTSQAKLDGQKLRKGTLTPEEQDALIFAADDLRAGAHIELDDHPRQSVNRIASNARRLKAKYGIRLLVVDYVQLLESELKRASRYEQVTEISKAMRWLTGELRIPVMVLAQLNREVEGRSDRKPKLSDLRDSGSLEQDAHTVILLRAGDEAYSVVADVAKQRNGPTDSVVLMFNRQWQRFDNWCSETPFLPE